MTASNLFRCVTPVQVRFNDFDPLGHMNNAVYMQVFDLGKSDYFGRLTDEPVDWTQTPVVIASINCDFLSPVVTGEEVEVRTRVSEIHDKSFIVLQELANSVTGEVKCTCRVVMVYFDIATKIPTRLPDDWRQRFNTFEQRNLEV